MEMFYLLVTYLRVNDVSLKCSLVEVKEILKYRKNC